MKNGLGSSKYKEAEYQRLKALVEAKRQESDLIGQKVSLVIIIKKKAFRQYDYQTGSYYKRQFIFCLITLSFNLRLHND